MVIAKAWAPGGECIFWAILIHASQSPDSHIELTHRWGVLLLDPMLVMEERWDTGQTEPKEIYNPSAQQDVRHVNAHIAIALHRVVG